MKRRSLLILSVITLLFASCGNKGGNSGLMVPEDAAVVVHINSPSLSSKLSWDDIRQTNWFKAMHREAPADDTLAQQLLADPASSGIDTKADMVFYVKKHGPGSYLIFTGSLSNAAAFEKLCKKMHTEGDIKKEGGFSYLDIKNEGAVVWNTSHFAYASNAPAPGTNYAVEKGEAFHMPNRFLSDSLRIFGMEALSLKKDDNLDKDGRFASLIKDSSDVHVWVNPGKYSAGMENILPVDTKQLLEDNISAISLNFDNGRISAKSKTWYGEKMSKLLADHKAEPVSAAVINRIPSANVAGVIAINYPPAAVKELLKMVGLDAAANIFLARADFSIDEFVKANKGEVLISFSDPITINKQDTIRNKKGGTTIGQKSSIDMKVLFATSVNDKAAFEKMVTIIWDLSKKMGGGEMLKNIPEISYKVENNWFAMSNSAEFRDKFLAGGDSKLPFVDKITGHPVGIYIDLQKIMGTFHSAFGNTGTPAAKGPVDAPDMWEDIVVKGGDYKDKATHFEFEVNLTDKNTNSLKQLNQYFDKMATIRKERMAKIKEITITDITSEEEMPPPPPKSKKYN